ncbi:MAG TPA: D-aminoacyl-tRNA deacylase [Thermoleophilia bacterium]|nr:D-aminoacyl-tRNA deacylase [Thermoleophilia bacterium]
MRVLLQRVTRAAVMVEGRTVGEIGSGLLALVGVAREDTAATAQRLAVKTAALRVFADDERLMNRSVNDTGGAILAVSQFTLYADTRRGNRPSFTAAAAAEQGEAIYEAYVAALRAAGLPVQTGVFGAHMLVELLNDGPVTVLLEA